MVGSVDLQVVRWSPPGAAASSAALVGAGASHVGQVRRVNEDSFLVAPPVFLVSDGMGGHSLGDVASSLVVEAFAPLRGREDLTPADVEQAIARSRVMIAAVESPDDAVSGATLVSASYVVEADRGYWLLAHVGDSRAYSYRAGQLELLTRDHSVVQELIEAGRISDAEAASHPERHVITRALGSPGNAQAEYSLVPLEMRQRILLCSDGLSGELSESSIAAILRNGGNPESTVGNLIDAAVEGGGRDNVTAVVIDVVDVSPPPDDREDTVPLRILEPRS